MKKVLSAILSILCVLTVCVSCKDNSSSEPICSFVDDSGKIVNLFQKPKKVAALFSSFAEMWNLIGGETSITVYESVERGIVPQDTLIVDGGAGKQIDVELLVSYKPDFVIASLDVLKQVETVEFLKRQNIPCALFRVENFLDYKSAMQRLCLVTENHELFDKNVTQVESEINAQKSRISKDNSKSILFLRAFSTGVKAKGRKDNFVCQMLSELHAVNIADETPLLLNTLSEEVILSKNPQIIFVSTMGNIQSAKDYVNGYLSGTLSPISAVKNNQVYFLDKNYFQYKPNNRWGHSYKILVDILLGEYEKQ